MKISDLVKMGLRNLARRKARTALTVIGVVIGTISIVVMVSIATGMNANYQEQVMELGSLTTITVDKYADIVDEDNNYVDTKEQTLDDSLVAQIATIEHVRAVTPYISDTWQLSCNKLESYTTVIAVDTSTLEVFDFPGLTSGEYPSDTNKQILLIGSEVMNQFYNPNSMFYEETTVDLTHDKVTFQWPEWNYQLSTNKKAFTQQIRQYSVIEPANNWEYDSAIYVDIDYYKEMYKKYCNTLSAEDRKKAVTNLTSYSTIKINVDNVNNVTKVQDQIAEMGFRTSSLAQTLEPMQETANMLEMVLLVIGGIAMVVSAISIANTMIMSIYERTKEIGVMKVLGCVVRDIKKLFLFESALIGMIGGVVGVIISFIVSFAINKYGTPIFQSLMGATLVTGEEGSKFSMIPFWLPAAAILFAMMVGLVSGYLPARRATKISAIEAMKTEG